MPNFTPVFTALRAILQKHAGTFTVAEDTAKCYRLTATVGRATLAAWRGKLKHPTMPVAWVEVRKNYVSYHLMPLYCNPKLVATLSPALATRMQGKSCLNFKTPDPALLKELAKVTAIALTQFRKAGFVA